MNAFLEKINSYREIVALKRLWASVKLLPSALFSPKKLIATFAVIAELISMLIFQTPQTARGQRINLDEWELYWSDEFDGDTLDTAKWVPSYTYKRRGGIWDKGQVFVSDGTLKIRTEYLENGPLGAGWYSEEISTKGLFEKKYGYFECRCICPGGMGLWAAFWLLSEGMFAEPDGSAADGCEIDLFESGFFGNKNPKKVNGVNQATGFDGYSEGSSGVVLGHYKGENIYTQYNTYGLEWNPDGYIFYINGVETARTDFGGVCAVPLYLIISLGIGPHIDENKELPAEFIVDYVRAYQYADRLND